MAGTFMFVTLFDPLRMPIIRFFDTAFGPGTDKRQRRSIGQLNLDQKIDQIFELFTKSLDRIALVHESVKNL